MRNSVYSRTMSDPLQGNPPKDVVTIRLDRTSKARLNQIAKAENRTVSTLIDLAVQEFLDRRLEARPEFLRVRHADLPDTSVLRAFFEMAPELFEKARKELDLPEFQFIDDRPEWNRVPVDLFRGQSDLVESVNRLPLFWHFKTEGSPTRLDWVVPFLQVFVGHCIFVRRDLAEHYLSKQQLKEFEDFRVQAQTGRDLSLRSLVAWVRWEGLRDEARALETIWKESIVGCQTGTDFHIAVRRVAPILSELSRKEEDLPITDPTISAVEDLNSGFQEFLNGTISAFTGNLLHSAELLTDHRETALLLAGPADLRVPSLNTLALRKGMLDPESGFEDEQGKMGRSILNIWGRAVRWFSNSVISTDSDAQLRRFLELRFPHFLADASVQMSTRPLSESSDRVKALQGLMQSWVKWLPDRAEAQAFFGVTSTLSGQDLVQHYQQLSDLLNPSAVMKAPQLSDPIERALWQFPELAGRAIKSLPNPVQPVAQGRGTHVPEAHESHKPVQERQSA
jgi:hypothetical protein